MGLNLQEMFKKMGSGEVKAHSELGTRDESKQNRNFGSRIQKMKTVTGINARVLVMKDVVLPFNPFTGNPDEEYNKKTPFRPILLVSQTIEGIKMACKENAELAEFWEKELGRPFTDGPTTLEEYQAFKSRGFIKPRVMSYSTVSMNFGGSHGFPDFRVKYTVDPTELNESGTYDYDNAPVWHKAAIFFNSMLKPEADEKKKKLEAAGQSKETVQNERRTIFSKSPVGFVNPTNLIPFIYLPLNEAPKKLDPEHPQELEQFMRFYSFTDKWTVPLKDALTNPMFDEVIDFFDFTIKTPSSEDTKKNNQVYTDEDTMELYTAMTINTTDGRLALKGGKTSVDGVSKDNEEVFANLMEVTKAYFLYSQEQSSVEGGETFEKIMALSNRFRPITSALPNFLAACNDVFNTSFAASPYCTDSIKRSNADFFTAMNPQNAMALAECDEEDLEEAHEKQRASVSEIIQENTTTTTTDTEVLGVGTQGIDTLELQDG